MAEFTDKVVLITGAAGNLGEAVARKFLASGAKLALIDRDAGVMQEKYADWVQHGDVVMIEGDLTDGDSVGEMVGAVVGHCGKIDVLANIAGGFTMGPPLHETDAATWEFMMNLNAGSVFLMCRAVVPLMLASGGGRIVNISARAAAEGKANMGPYCASKSAVITLTQTLAAENKFKDINVNCILPGTIDTPQNRADMPDADFNKWVAPAALADVVAFLSSDAARAISGAAVPVYGQS